MTKSRDAIDTIRGYYYQFDLTISQILSQENEDVSITIEGIEDIDITALDDNHTIQCKYYEKSTYQHSLIKDAIVFFAEHYSKVKNFPEKKIKYTLYGHYNSGHEKLNEILDVDFYKENFFTYKKYKKIKVDGKNKNVLESTILKHKEFSLSDSDILDFISLVKIDINGKKFDDLESHVIDQLVKIFDCSKIEADYYYNNSLAAIRLLAINPVKNLRTITKSEFIKKITKTKKQIFNVWYSKIRGSQKYNKYIKESLFNKDRNSNYFRIFIIECNGFENNELLNFLIEFSKKWSNQDSKRLVEKFCPTIYLHNFVNNDLIEIKSLLISNGILIEDGHYYNQSNFNSKLFVRDPTNNICNYRINLKIINTIENLELVLEEKTNFKTIFQFYRSYPFFSNSKVLHHDIYFEDLNSIKEMIL